MPNEDRVPQATIVTALYEYRACEKIWLEAISNQSVRSDQLDVIIVDAICHPTFGELLREIVPDAVNIVYEKIPQHGRARALNHALSIAKSELIIFLADDFVPACDFAATHLRFHQEHPEAEAVGIGVGLVPPQLSNDLAMWLETSGRLFGIPFSETITAIPEDYFYVGNASVKRELLNRAGAFDELFLYHAGDDYEFGQRLRAAGMKSRLLRAARASHHHSLALHERACAHRDLGRNARAVAKRAGQDSWLRRLELCAAVWRTRTVATRTRAMLTRTSAARERWWAAMLNAAFADGYCQGQNGNQPD